MSNKSKALKNAERRKHFHQIINKIRIYILDAVIILSAIGGIVCIISCIMASISDYISN